MNKHAEKGLSLEIRRHPIYPRSLGRLVHFVMSGEQRGGRSAAEKDYDTQTLLDWYIKREVEEENQPAEIIKVQTACGDEHYNRIRTACRVRAVWHSIGRVRSLTL